MNRKGTADWLLVLIVALVILLVWLAFTFKFSDLPFTQQTCIASIREMNGLATPMTSGEGIRCPTGKVDLDSKKWKSIQALLAHQLSACATQFGLFTQNPFHGTKLDTVCVICSTVNAPEPFKDVDLALIEKQGNAVPYTTLTGRGSTTGLDKVYTNIADNFAGGKEYAVVWVTSNARSLEEVLNGWGMRQKGDLWHSGLIELIPGESVTAPAETEPIIGAGQGMFSAGAEGPNRVVLLLSKDAAIRQGCAELTDAPYKPIA